jgi:hypothetical protein
MEGSGYEDPVPGIPNTAKTRAFIVEDVNPYTAIM